MTERPGVNFRCRPGPRRYGRWPVVEPSRISGKQIDLTMRQACLKIFGWSGSSWRMAAVSVEVLHACLLMTQGC